MKLSTKVLDRATIEAHYGKMPDTNETTGARIITGVGNSFEEVTDEGNFPILSDSIVSGRL